MSTYPHRSVLLDEVIETFSSVQPKVLIDGTLGAGGHAEGLLRAYPCIERYIGIDQDPSALAIAEERLAEWHDKVTFLRGNFGDFTTLCDASGIDKIDGILLDLGVSSMQIDRAERGFSFSNEGPLDMRMNPSASVSAETVVNEWDEATLGKIFRQYGEERRWRLAAQRLVEVRKKQRITTTRQLVAALTPVLRSPRGKGINPLTLIFQAIRIAVNSELDVLEKVLPQAIDKLTTGGRLAVISFHSLEDRMVKRCFRYAASDKEDTVGLGGLFRDKKPIVDLVTRRPIVATDQEIDSNPRSRSARLRVIEKV